MQQASSIYNALLIVNGRNIEVAQSEQTSLEVAITALDTALDLGELNKTPQLRHYLENRSYQKALHWMEQNVQENL